MNRATRRFPLPLSPVTSTVASVAAARCAWRRISAVAWLPPTIAGADASVPSVGRGVVSNTAEVQNSKRRARLLSSGKSRRVQIATRVPKRAIASFSSARYTRKSRAGTNSARRSGAKSSPAGRQKTGKYFSAELHAAVYHCLSSHALARAETRKLVPCAGWRRRIRSRPGGWSNAVEQ